MSIGFGIRDVQIRTDAFRPKNPTHCAYCGGRYRNDWDATCTNCGAPVPTPQWITRTRNLLEGPNGQTDET